MAAITLFLHAPATNISSERLLSPSESISSLRSRLEHLTGIPPTAQKISLYTSRTDDPSPSAPPRLVTPVRSEPASDEEDEITLMMLGVREGMGIKVEDTRPPDVARMYTDESLLKERFELTEEEYASRSDTVLSYKQRHKMGRFDPNAVASAEAEAASLEDQVAWAQRTYPIGSRCEVEGGYQRRGAVRFVGTTEFAKGVWVGVEYDEPVGKGDGSVNGSRYFTCSAKHGGFIKPDKVKVGDYPPIEPFDEDDEEF